MLILVTPLTLVLNDVASWYAISAGTVKDTLPLDTAS